MSMASPFPPYTENNRNHSILTRVNGEASLFRSFSLPMNSSILSAMACSIAYHKQTRLVVHLMPNPLTPVSRALTSTLEWEHGTHTSQWATAANLRFINSAGQEVGLIFLLIQPFSCNSTPRAFIASGLQRHLPSYIHTHTQAQSTQLKIHSLKFKILSCLSSQLGRQMTT